MSIFRCITVHRVGMGITDIIKTDKLILHSSKECLMEKLKGA